MRINQNNLAKENRVSLQQKLFLVFVVLSMIPLFFAAKSIFTGFAQTRNKQEKIIKKVSFDNEPIEFLSLESDGKTIKPNEKFVQEGDWLKDFTIKFKNISGKPIVYLSIVISFPETGFTGKPMAHFLKYGIHPLAKINTNDIPSLLASNDTAEVKLSTEDSKNLKNFLAQRNTLSDLTEANFRIMAVYFEDGTHWSAGSMFRPDPDSPGKFIPVENKPQEDEK